jgi:tetratricopeptide (TPR) repeat protein
LAAEADYRSGGHAAILQLLDEARRAGDPIAVADALNLAHHCLVGPGQSDLRKRLAEQLVAESQRTGRRSDVLLGVFWQAVDGILDGDPYAERGLSELRSLLVTDDNRAIRYVVRAVEVMHEIRAGRWEDAEYHAKQCLAMGTCVGDVDATGWYGAQLTAIRWFQGRLVEVLSTLEQMVASPTLSAVDHSHLAGLAVAYARAGQTRQAGQALARLTSIGLAQLPRSSTWLVTMYAAIEAAALLDDADLATDAYRLLAPFAAGPVLASLGVACFGSAHHPLGVAALTFGDVPRAVEHFNNAVRDNTALGHWPAVTLSRYRLAYALSRDPQRRERSLQELSQARRDADEVDMVLPDEPWTAGLGAAGQRPGQVPDITFERLGGHWSVRLNGGATSYVPDSRGMAHLSVLMANPGREISATELVIGPELEAPALAQQTRNASGQTLLDERAMREYRQRLNALHDEIDRLDKVGDRTRSIEVHAELAWLQAQIKSATGLSGRRRTFAMTDERARIAVGKAIRRALGYIQAADPVLGDILSRSIETGRHCVYLRRA